MLMEDDKKSKFCPTSASSRKMAAVHGSCGASPAPVGPFRSRPSLESAEDKKYTPDQSFRVEEKFLAVPKVLINQDKINTDHAQVFGDKVSF